MGQQQVAHHRIHLTRCDLRLPLLHHSLATQLCQCVQPLAEKGAILDEEIVVLQQQAHALVFAEFQRIAGAGANGQHQGLGHGEVAHLAALRFHIDRSTGIELAQGIPHQRVEVFLAGLWLAGDQAQHGAAVRGQVFQVQHLCAFGAQGLQQPGLARARGAANHPPLQGCHALRQVQQHGVSVGFVAAFDQRDLEANLAQHQGQ